MAMIQPVQAGVGFVQGATTNLVTTSASRESLTIPATTGAGNLIAGYIWWGNTKANLQSITGCGNSYTLVGNPLTGGSGRAAGFYAKNIAGGACTTTANFSRSPQSVVIVVHEVSGADKSTPLVARASNYQSAPGTGANAVTSGTAATTNSGDYVFGATLAANSATVTSAGTGLTGRVSGSNHGILSEDFIQTNGPDQ